MGPIRDPSLLRLSAIVDRFALACSRHWLLAANAFFGLFLGLAVAAPALMALGFEGIATLLYRFYALNCHQLPQRSYFLFGPNGIDSYSLDQILSWGADSHNLRAFIGNAQIGYKMAVAHRVTALFGGLFTGGITYGLLGRYVSWPKKLGAALMAPMVLDGVSHLVSEVTGLGFREANRWAMWLTSESLPAAFYSGTRIGTLNWLLRTGTGFLFGFAVVWTVYPLVAHHVLAVARTLARRQSWPGHLYQETESMGVKHSTEMAPENVEG